MDWNKLRAWWFTRQGLDGSLEGKSSTKVLSRAGWARSVGGSNPYLTLFSRARIGAREAQKDVASGAIGELPSARGCTYFLPKEDYAIGLLCGRGFGERAAMNTAKKYLGVTEKEIDRLCEAVLNVLGDEPLDPKQIKERVGDAARSLGEEGKKRGQTTTLSLALGRLQTEGEICRRPINGRLDTQRFGYIRWNDSPLANSRMTQEEAFVLLAKKYFNWIGCATAAHFRWFTGLRAGAATKALEQIELVKLNEDWLIPPQLIKDYENFKMPVEPIYRLVSSVDSLLLLRRDIPSFLDKTDAKVQMATEKGLKLVGGLQDLENNAILDRGRLVGLWEFDPDRQEVVAYAFAGEINAALRREIAETERFIAEDLGDARSFSLDSPQSRGKKLKSLRTLAGKR